MIPEFQKKTIIRAAGVLLMLVAAMGPWFADSHWATEDTCADPLVWLGDGHCVYLMSVPTLWVEITSGQCLICVLTLSLALPYLSSMLLFLFGERWRLLAFHGAAWGITAGAAGLIVYKTWQFYDGLTLWGSALGSVVAGGMFIWEVVMDRRKRSNDS